MKSKIQDPKSKSGKLWISILHFPFSIFPGAAAVLIAALFLSGCSDPPSPKLPRTQAPTRIISLAPSITEILFELGLGEKVVGVTRYCDYPPEATEKQEVGGYLDVNYEAVVALQPDLVIHISQHEEARQRLDELGIKTLAVNHSRVVGIVDSITLIADRCGAKEAGEDLRRNLESKIQKIQNSLSSMSPRPPPALSSSKGVSASEGSPPRVLIAVGRSLEPGASGEIYVSGRDGFYDDLIRLAGGQNAYGDETLKFPALSAEGIVQLDPDVIIEMIPDLGPEMDMEGLLARWNDIPGLQVARSGRVHILGGDHVVVPGPRFVTLLEEMADLIHGDGK